MGRQILDKVKERLKRIIEIRKERQKVKQIEKVNKLIENINERLERLKDKELNDFDVEELSDAFDIIDLVAQDYPHHS